MKIKQVVKIWLAERPGGWLCYQCLEMPEELRGNLSITMKNGVEIQSNKSPMLNNGLLDSFEPETKQFKCLVNLQGTTREDDNIPECMVFNNAIQAKQKILSAFDEWSGGLKVHCTEPDTYAWLVDIGEDETGYTPKQDCLVWEYLGESKYRLNQYSAVVGEHFYLAEPLPENDK